MDDLREYNIKFEIREGEEIEPGDLLCRGSNGLIRRAGKYDVYCFVYNPERMTIDPLLGILIIAL